MTPYRRFDNRPAQVMVIEDNRGDAILISRAFSRAQTEVTLTVAETGEAALARLAREGVFVDQPLPDLILLDFNLPRLSGLAVLEQVKGSDALRHIPIIVLSSTASEADVQRSYSLQAAGFIIKPIRLEQLQQVVDRLTAFFFTRAVLSEPPAR